jgi:hypothetical protein
MEVAEVAKLKTPDRKGIELVPKVERPKKTKASSANPSKTATKKASYQAHSRSLSREMIEKVAYQKWVQRGCRHGYALEDWIRAEKELLERAS